MARTWIRLSEVHRSLVSHPILICCAYVAFSTSCPVPLYHGANFLLLVYEKNKYPNTSVVVGSVFLKLKSANFSIALILHDDLAIFIPTRQTEN